MLLDDGGPRYARSARAPDVEPKSRRAARRRAGPHARPVWAAIRSWRGSRAARATRPATAPHRHGTTRSSARRAGASSRRSAAKRRSRCSRTPAATKARASAPTTSSAPSTRLSSVRGDCGSPGTAKDPAADLGGSGDRRGPGRPRLGNTATGSTRPLPARQRRRLLRFPAAGRPVRRGGARAAGVGRGAHPRARRHEGQAARIAQEVIPLCDVRDDPEGDRAELQEWLGSSSPGSGRSSRANRSRPARRAGALLEPADFSASRLRGAAPRASPSATAAAGYGCRPTPSSATSGRASGVDRLAELRLGWSTGLGTPRVDVQTGRVRRRPAPGTSGVCSTASRPNEAVPTSPPLPTRTRFTSHIRIRQS